MGSEWIEYVRKFDSLVQEALRTCIKNSITTFYNTLHGDGTMGPSPLIAIDIDLSGRTVFIHISQNVLE